MVDSFWQLWRRLMRPLLWTARVVAVVALLAGSIVAAQFAERYARTSDTFAISEIVVAGEARLSKDAILDRAGLALGLNVFERSPADVEAALESHPWIASSSVRRRLPGYFEITVREHLPVAVLFLDSDDPLGARGYLVGDEGTVFKELEENDPNDLPVVTGVDELTFSRDPHHRSSVLLSVVALLHDWRAAGLWRRAPVSEIHVGRGGAFSVYVGDPLFLARLGSGPYRPKLRRLRQVLDRLEAANTPPEYIYLDNTRRPDRVTLRLRPVPGLIELPEEMEVGAAQGATGPPTSG